MNTTTLTPTLKLYRPWPLRLLDRVRVVWEHWRDERLARQAVESALELPEETLRDMGAPLWLQAQAQARRESARLDRELMRVRDALGPHGYY